MLKLKLVFPVSLLTLLALGPMWVDLLVKPVKAARPMMQQQALRPNKYVIILYNTYFNNLLKWEPGYAVWPVEPPQEGQYMWWGLPARGPYRSTDERVINGHADQLVMAGVDIIAIDVSNSNINTPDHWVGTESLLRVYSQRHRDGIPTPKITFYTSQKTHPAGNDLERLFWNVYANGAYDSRIYFYYGAKPLLLVTSYECRCSYDDHTKTETCWASKAQVNDCGCRRPLNGRTVGDFFECRSMDGFEQEHDSSSGGKAIHNWSFINYYNSAGDPQPAFMKAGFPEAIAVSAAQQVGAMNNPDSRGRNYDATRDNNTGYAGQNFEDQMNSARLRHPTFLIIKGWNEWVAHKIHGQFVDEHSPAFSNDIEPFGGTFPGGLTGDHYLWRLWAHARGFKMGNSPNLTFFDSSTGQWTFKEGRGGSQFAANNFVHTFDWVGGQPVAADFDDDGMSDIAIRNPSNGLWYFAISQGNGHYSHQKSFFWPSPAHFQPLAGDFNRDGQTDIALYDPDGGRWYFAYKVGDTVYANTHSFYWPTLPSFQPIVGDWNEDGNLDIGMRNPYSGEFYLARNIGQAVYHHDRTFRWSNGFQFQPVSGDFNCDGITDLAVRDINNGKIHIFNGLGDGSSFRHDESFEWRAGQQFLFLSPPKQCTKSLTLRINDGQNEAPTITSINPTQVTAGGGDFTLTVNGINFAPGIVVRVDGGGRPTTLVNDSQVTMTITAADIVAHGSRTITVFNPAPGGRTSNQVSFDITPNCSYSIIPLNRAFSSAGGTATITVTAPPGCNSTADSTDTWITLTPPTSGSGNGSVSYTVATNPNNFSRQGLISVGGQTFTVLQGAFFADVAPENIFFETIGKMSARGVTAGCGFDGQGNRLYCPGSVVTREQMSVFLIRAAGQPPPPTPASQRFADVATTHPFYNFIEEMAVRQITSGCGFDGQGNRLYCPGNLVTREQMAVFMVRALGVLSPPTPATQRFADVLPTHPFYNFIEEMAVRNVTSGCGFDGQGNRIYCPSNIVTREQMSAFLVRAFGL